MIAGAWAGGASVVAAQAQQPPAEVVVTAQRPGTQVQLDRKVYRTSGDLQSATGTAADVLNNVASVSVDSDGNVALRGDTNITILVDGKVSAQFNNASRGASILSLPAGNIDHIEVMTTPPAQYKAEGAGGVINIVTKHSNKLGASGLLRLTLGNERRWTAGLDADYNFGPVKLHGGFNYRQDYKERVATDARNVIDPVSGVTAASSQRIDERFLRRIPSVDLSAEGALNPNEAVSATLHRRTLTGKRYFDQDDASGAAGAGSSAQSLRHSDGHERSPDEAEGLAFEQKLRSADETLKLSIDHSVTSERERYFYTNSFFLPPAAGTTDTLHLSFDLAKIVFGADYTLKTPGDVVLKLGYNIEDSRNVFDDTGEQQAPGGAMLIPNPVIENHFRYHQQTDAMYGDVRGSLGAWIIDAGLRVEDAHAATFQQIGAVAGRSSDFGVYPSVHLERPIDAARSIFLSVARRITRPDAEALNPFLDTQDTHNLRQGNPDLRPRDTWIYEVGYAFSQSGQNYGATLYFRTDRNAVTDILKTLSAEVVLATKTNLPLSRSGGLEFNLGGRWGEALSYSASGEAFYAQIDATALGYSNSRSNFGVNLKANIDYRPSKADLFQASFNRADARLTPQGEVQAINLLNLGYRRTVSDTLSLVATLSDAMNSQRQIRTVSTTAFMDRYERHQLGRVLYVGFSYAFGGATKASKPNFEYDK